MSCPHCFTGHINPGTPTGRWDTVHGLRTYIAEPAQGQQTKGIIVIVPDAFGVEFVNNQILADHYASAAQFRVYLPDFMNGNSCTVQTMTHMAYIFDEKTSLLWKPYYVFATVIHFVPFLIRNRLGVCWPRVTDFLRNVREKETLPVGVAGFCWGGLHTIKLAHDNPDTQTKDGRPLADAFFTAHPSNVSMPGDVTSVARNLSIAIGDQDAVMNIQQVREAEKILEGKVDLDSEVVVYPGAKHGFSVRASRVEPDSKETEQAEAAEKQAIAWFQRQFAKLA